MIHRMIVGGASRLPSRVSRRPPAVRSGSPTSVRPTSGPASEASARPSLGRRVVEGAGGVAATTTAFVAADEVLYRMSQDDPDHGTQPSTSNMVEEAAAASDQGNTLEQAARIVLGDEPVYDGLMPLARVEALREHMLSQAPDQSSPSDNLPTGPIRGTSRAEPSVVAERPQTDAPRATPESDVKIYDVDDEVAVATATLLILNRIDARPFLDRVNWLSDYERLSPQRSFARVAAAEAFLYHPDVLNTVYVVHVFNTENRIPVTDTRPPTRGF